MPGLSGNSLPVAAITTAWQPEKAVGQRSWRGKCLLNTPSPMHVVEFFTDCWHLLFLPEDSAFPSLLYGRFCMSRIFMGTPTRSHNISSVLYISFSRSLISSENSWLSISRDILIISTPPWLFSVCWVRSTLYIVETLLQIES